MFSPTKDQLQLRDDVARLAAETLNEGAAERDKAEQFSHEQWQTCGAHRLPGLPVPEELGGRGLDPLSMVLALEGLAQGCRDGGLVFSLGAHLLACVVPVWRFGTPSQHARHFPGLCDGSIIAANAFSEPDAGSDIFAMTTEAVADGDTFVITGKKTFSTNAPVAKLLLVLAVTDRDTPPPAGVTAFLVDARARGVTIGPPLSKMGVRTSPFSEVRFENVRVDADAVLGGIGGGGTIFDAALSWERIGLAATHLGVMDHLLGRAVRHARTRKQFGEAIGHFQAVSHPLADMRVRLEAGRLLTYRAALRLGESRDASLHASMVKLFVSEAFAHAARTTVQIFGGSGYLVDQGLERILRDATGSTIYSGTSEVQRMIIARWMGLS